MKWLFSNGFAQLLLMLCLLFRYRLISQVEVTWFKSWFLNLHYREATLTFLLSQTLRQFEIYEQIFQVSLVVEECLEKGKKQKRLFITWCFTQPTTLRHSMLFLRLGQLRSYKNDRCSPWDWRPQNRKHLPVAVWPKRSGTFTHNWSLKAN